MQDDAAYYRKRAQEEVEAAMTADRTAARKAHLELAERYSDLADAMEKRDRDTVTSFPERSPSNS